MTIGGNFSADERNVDKRTAPYHKYHTHSYPDLCTRCLDMRWRDQLGLILLAAAASRSFAAVVGASPYFVQQLDQLATNGIGVFESDLSPGDCGCRPAGLSPAGETIVTKVSEEIFTTESVDRKSLLQMYANLRPAQRSRVRVEVHPDVWDRMLIRQDLNDILFTARGRFREGLFGWPVEIKDEPGLTLRLVVDAQP